MLKAQIEHTLDDSDEILSVGEAEGGQERDRMAAGRAEQTLHADGQRLLMVADVARIAVVADHLIRGSAAGTGFRTVEAKLREFTLVTMDVGT